MQILAIIFLLFSLVTGLLIGNRYSTIDHKIQQEILSGSQIAFTGNTTKGPTVSGESHTGDITPATQSSLDRFEKMKEKGFIRTFSPKAQPIIDPHLSYQQRSDILNGYLSKNNSYFTPISSISDGYLYIRLTQPIRQYDIFLYFHDSRINGQPMSGKLSKIDNLITGERANTEFLYRLDSISMSRFFDGKKVNFNWLGIISQIDTAHFIGGYTTSSNGNSIDEITIVGS